VLFALIFRAVSFEFYAHDPAWRKVWDWSFFLGSALPALLFGVAAGNIVRGVPLDKMGEFTGNFFTLLNPYALVLGVLGLVMFLWQGAAWLAVKSENALYDRAVKTRSLMAWVFVVLVLVATAATFLLVPRAAGQVMASPVGWVFLLLLLVSMAWGRFVHGGKDLHSWYAASLAPVALIGLWAVSIFPRLVPAINDDALSLTVANSASSQLTLTVMTIIAAIGVPLVLFYIYLVYRIFAGKVRAGGEGY
jgi:cytochrome d ubiquinol oxidase subunit II